MTRRRTKWAVTVLVSSAAVGALTACGDAVTANHDWQSTSRRTSVTTVVNGVSQTVVVFDGILTTGLKGKGVAGTVFREECVSATDAKQGPYRCLMLLNTGSKVYVAAGQVPSPYVSHELATLTDPVRAFHITQVAGGTMSSVLRISARTHF